MPYISASIIIQLMGTIYGPWEKLRKEGGEAGRKQLNQYTRYLTVVLAVAQSFGIAMGLQSQPQVVQDPGLFFIVSTMAILTGGTLFLMWLGEQITARGVGNGVSLLIFAGIVAQLPTAILNLFSLARTGSLSPFLLLLVLGVLQEREHVYRGSRSRSWTWGRRDRCRRRCRRGSERIAVSCYNQGSQKSG